MFAKWQQDVMLVDAENKRMNFRTLWQIAALFNWRRPSFSTSKKSENAGKAVIFRIFDHSKKCRAVR
jgi:hypothetical protein